MAKFRSIKSKLITNTMIIIVSIFIVVLSVVTYLNISNVNKNIAKSKVNIENSLIAKGKTLANNNSMAMQGMAEDNAFTAIQSLVSSTVKDDKDIVYGIYMDNMLTPWVYANLDNPTGIPKKREPLEDSMSQWASNIEKLNFKTVVLPNDNVIEFAAPVIVDEEAAGWIRYGISTESMVKLLAEAQADGEKTRNTAIIILISLGVVAVLFGFIIIKSQAVKITKPIESLVASTGYIAEGNYSMAVDRESNDEIGNLAERFEGMRVTIKKYTEHLQDLVDEKMQEVNDILNNIDQGLFTINMDGTVNDGYSAKTNKILKVDNVAVSTVKDLLRFDEKHDKAFKTWLDLVEKRHNQLKWNKLEKLAPVRELELMKQQNEDTDHDYVRVSYQKIFDKNNKLKKIMILAHDETEKRMKDLMMQEEKLRHENEMQTILGIANTPSDEILEFVEDTLARQVRLHEKVNNHLENVKIQREAYPDGPEYDVTTEMIAELFRDIHTIKGNGGTYGFQLLSQYAHHCEDLLEELKEPVKIRREDTLQNLKKYLEKIDQEMENVQGKIKLIFGNEEDLSVKVPMTRVEKIQKYCNEIKEKEAAKQLVESLVDECMTLSWKTLGALTRKYQKIALKAARSLEKNIRFVVENDQTLYPEDALTPYDEILLHIIRNAVDHGIEKPEIREELGKGVGEVKIGFSKENGNAIFTVADNGAGINQEKLLEKCINKNIISTEDASKLSDSEINQLLFTPGLSTAETVTDISGRGVGMDVVKKQIEKLNGTIEIESVAGQGTQFKVAIPTLD